MKLFVGNLSFEMDEKELKDLFRPHTQITSIEIIRDDTKNKSRGFGFVEIPDEIEVENIISRLNGFPYKGRKLRVELAKSPPRFHPVQELIQSIKKIKEFGLDEASNKFWQKIERDFPAFLSNYHTIADSFDLKPVLVEEKLIRNVFILSSDHLPDYGYGIYTAFTDDKCILLIHSFLRRGKPKVSCWRSRVIWYQHKGIIRMPPKRLSNGRTKRNTWREKFEYFISDISEMLNRIPNVWL
jgi:RNA recognition motif-containing protein